MNKTNKLRRACCKSNIFLKRSSPTILSCIAAVGVVATTVMAVRATPKAMQLLKKTTDEKGEDLSGIDIVLTAAPMYIPTAIVGLSTIACILGANVLNKRQQASFMSAYALLNESYKEYKNAACTVYGEDADSKIKAAVAEKAYVSADGCSLYSPDLDPCEDNLLFYDIYSKRYFRATLSSVINAQYHINRNLQLRGYACVNEFYEFLGIAKIDGGDDIGWSMDELMENGLMWLDFDNLHTELDDGLECYIVESLYEPIILFE